jgi:alanyl-tRNA synthetase
VVLDKTPLYAEMGGQVADHGTIDGKDGAVFDVTDVQKDKAGKVPASRRYGLRQPQGGRQVSAMWTSERRKAVHARPLRHPSAADAALQEVLGDHVRQAGSYVDEDS